MTDTQRTAQELADELDRIADPDVSKMYLHERAALCASAAELRRLAALASQAEPVARVIRNESGQVYFEWRDGKTPLDFVGATLCATPPAPAQAEQNQSVCLKLDWCAQVLRSIADRGRSALGVSYPDVLQVLDAVNASREILAAPAQAAPIDMVLHCPACGLQHVDAPDRAHYMPGTSQEWDNPPHRSHLCHGCGHVWRPADVPTNGVQAVKTKGKADSPIAQPARSGNESDA